MTKLYFPKGFLWGAATAAHQIEGDNHNDWSEWEKTNAERLARESEQSFAHNPHWENFRAEATNPKNYISGIACDHYHRYEQDFDVAQSLNHNALRFSIEWSRIEPEKGKFDEREIEHYRQVIAALRARDMEPFVTLLHFTLPIWLAEKDGVLDKNFPCYFEFYTKKMVTALGANVRFWITINEPDIYAGGAYMKGIWPPMQKNIFAFFKALGQQVSAHKLAYAVIKKVAPHAQVGIAKHNVWFEAYNNTLVNRFLKKIADYWWNNRFLQKIKNEQDFIGLNHYNHSRINWGFNKNENKIQSDFGWEFYPESLYHALIELKSYNKPIYITENGIADAKDILRKKFIRESLISVHRAIEGGADVHGYLYWSLLDNFEWDKGFWLRFGLVEVDYKTLERTIRPSALAYAKICKENALEITDNSPEN